MYSCTYEHTKTLTHTHVLLLSLIIYYSHTYPILYNKGSFTILLFALNVMRMLLGTHIHTSLVYTVTTNFKVYSNKGANGTEVAK